MAIIDYFKKPHDISVEKTQANCYLTLTHQGYYLKDAETSKCHNSFAVKINLLLTSDQYLPRFSIVDKKLCINLLIDFDTDKEFKHGVHHSKNDICQSLQETILNTLSTALRNQVNEVSVKIVYSPAIKANCLAVQFGNNAFHGKQEDIYIKITRLFQNSKDSSPFIVGYKQQRSIAIDYFLLENDLVDAANVLQGSFIGFINKVDDLVNGPQPVPEATTPTKDWSYQWDNNQITLWVKDESNQKQELRFIVEFNPDFQINLDEPSINEDLDIPKVSIEDVIDDKNITSDPIISITTPKPEIKLTPERTFQKVEDAPKGNVVKLNSNLKRKRQSDKLCAEDTFTQLEPTLKLVLESVITKGDYLSKYGIKQVETDRLNGREQTPTNTAFIDLGIEQLWQVNDKVSIEVKNDSNIVFGRTTEELDSLMNYQAINNADERYPLARFGLSREHLNIAKHSEKELTLSTINEKKPVPAYIINESKHSLIKTKMTIKEGERLLIGLFVFKLVYKL